MRGEETREGEEQEEEEKGGGRKRNLEMGPSSCSSPETLNTSFNF